MIKCVDFDGKISIITKTPLLVVVSGVVKLDEIHK